jgi:hypothetical protein
MVSSETAVMEEEQRAAAGSEVAVEVAMDNDCSCVIVSLGGDDDEDDDAVVAVVSNETLRCSVGMEEMTSSLPTIGEIFFLFGVVEVIVDDLMT